MWCLGESGPAGGRGVWIEVMEYVELIETPSVGVFTILVNLVWCSLVHPNLSLGTPGAISCDCLLSELQTRRDETKREQNRTEQSKEARPAEAANGPTEPQSRRFTESKKN